MTQCFFLIRQTSVSPRTPRAPRTTKEWHLETRQDDGLARPQASLLGRARYAWSSGTDTEEFAARAPSFPALYLRNARRLGRGRSADEFKCFQNSSRPQRLSAAIFIKQGRENPWHEVVRKWFPAARAWNFCRRGKIFASKKQKMLLKHFACFPVCSPAQAIFPRFLLSDVIREDGKRRRRISNFPSYYFLVIRFESFINNYQQCTCKVAVTKV